MTVASKTVECNASEYIKLTAAQTGYALIQVPNTPDKIPRRLAIVVAATKPLPTFDGNFVLNADDAFERKEEIDNYIWGKMVSGGPLKIPVVE